MPELSPLAVLSVGLFGLTALLVIVAMWIGPRLPGRVLALSALATVSAANYAMLGAYEGEKEIVYGRIGPIERRVVRARGHFEYVDKDDAEGSAEPTGDRSASSQGPASPAAVDDGNIDRNATGASGSRSLLARFMPASWGDRGDLRGGDTLRDCSDCPEMVVIEPGFFRMGAAVGDSDALPSERPRRMVKVPRRYAIARAEVTVSQFKAFARATGRPDASCATAEVGGSAAPVGCIGFRDAVDYVAWLGLTTGRTYRLPTEAEWEWAARGGTDQRYVTGHSLARIGSNGFGLVGIHGGAAEWVAGCWSDTLAPLPGDAAIPNRHGDCRRQVVRDAAAHEPDILSRLSARRPVALDDRRPHVGFRVVRDF